MSKLNRKTIPIKGMHCRSCEIVIEEELLKVSGVKKAVVNEKKGTAEIYMDGEVSDIHIENAVCNAGYSLGHETKGWISKNPKDYSDLLKSAVALVILYFVAKNLGLFNIAFNSSNNLASLPVVLLVGITAGLSTCMALVGGLVLGVSARFAEKHPSATPFQKFKPHILFNLGRIIFFGIFGGIIGYFGSLFQLSPSSIGFMTIFVGLVMLTLGLQTLDMFPKLNRIKFTLPKGLYTMLGINKQKDAGYSNQSAFMLGALTFFLPCGFTQAMQLYAISSGSALTGALTMSVFALGTAPGLLSVGGLTSVIKGAFAKPFYKFVGLMVIALSLFNISNGSNLMGLTLPKVGDSSVTAQAATDPNVTLTNGIQIVRMTQSYNGYSPRTFTIQKGVPVKWIITSTDANTCASSIYSAQIGVRKYLTLGENTIEFTPDQVGTIKFSCSMGMYTGAFNVVDGSASGNTSGSASSGYTQTTSNNVASGSSAPVSCGGAGGGCGGCGGGARRNTTTNSGPAVPANTEGDTQVIKATYTVNGDLQPNIFTVKANQPVRFEVEAKEDGVGCMGSIALPGLAQNYEVFQKGQTAVFNFTPTKAGSYQITCAMGVPRGTITVQ